jgi:acetolactate synthase-1/2/3 large subunit
MTSSLQGKARLGGHALVEALVAQGVDTVFGVPGESFLAVLDGLHEHRGRIRFVACRQEGGAAFMAEATGKLSGRPGVCIVTRGPGASNAAIGLHTAFQDSTPMLLLVGQVGADHRDREAFQEVDYRQMFGPGTLGMAKWVAEVHDGERLPEYLARAFHVAMQGRPGPVVLALPEDMLTAPVAAAVLPRVEPVLAWPAPGALRSLRSELMAAQRPLVLLGGSGWDGTAAAAFERFADNWHLPVVCGLRRQDLFDNRHTLYAGDMAIGINPALAAAVHEADLLLVVGARLGEMTTSGYRLLEPPRARQRLVHLHPGAEELGRVFAADLLLHCAPAAAARALEGLTAPLQVPWRDWTARLHQAYLDNLASEPIEPIDLAEVVRQIEALVPPATIYANGAGNHTGWLHRFHRHVGLRHHGRTQLGPTSGAMGYGLPAAVAAALRHPDRMVIHWAGDGELLMTVQEMATAASLAASAGARGFGQIVSVVVDNASYGTIRMHQERAFPGRTCGTALHNPDFVALAHSFGWAAETVATTVEFAPAFERLRHGGRPALLHLPFPIELVTTRQRLSSPAP